MSAGVFLQRAGILSSTAAPSGQIDAVEQSLYVVVGTAAKNTQAVLEQSGYVVTGYGVKDNETVNEQTMYVVTN